MTDANNSGGAGRNAGGKSDSKLAELEKKAQEYARQKEYGQKAVELNLAIIELDKGRSAAYLRLAACYLYNAQFEEADLMSQEALRLNPSNQSAQRFQQRLIVARASFDQAQSAATYREAVEGGRTAKEAGNAGLAIQYYHRARRLCQTAHEYLICTTGLAGAFRAKGDPDSLDKAEEYYHEVLKLDPGSKVATTGLAAVLSDRKEVTQARKLYQSVLGQDWDNPYALRGMAGIYAQSGDKEAAKRKYAHSYYAQQRRNNEDNKSL